MGIGFIYLLIIILIILIVSIIFLIRSIISKSKIGIIISSIVILFVFLLFSMNKIDEITINKNDINKDLKIFNIQLKNEYKILENNVSGMPERNQETKIEISKQDAENIIHEITNSNNFKNLTTSEEISKDADSEGRWNSKKMLNYKYPDFYGKEIYTEIDNIPTRISLSIETLNGKNILSYSKIED
ncbi:hypothetical protein [Daejeonia sp. YH14]|uniref:hypothetical protein n=1 Tax=Daejeonia sp. YH14 TaxID=3439042 RepID=UPI003F498B68